MRHRHDRDDEISRYLFYREAQKNPKRAARIYLTTWLIMGGILLVAWLWNEGGMTDRVLDIYQSLVH